MRNTRTILRFTLSITLLSGCSAIVTTQPTNSEIMVIPVSPGEGFIYINDSWDWNPGAHSYQATPGRWVAPKKSAVWVNGAWKKKRGGWKYNKGYWRSN
jgi:WXXGXW repeat (2 copies)